MRHFGIDVHQKTSEICGITEEGEIFERRQLATTEASLRRYFGRQAKAVLVMECGPLTPWLYRLLDDLGHEVRVVNPRRVRLIAESTLKTDGIDAEVLARLSRLDMGFLRPVYQRSRAAQELRSRLRVRSALVKSRTALINCVRGTLRAQGYRLRSCTAARFVPCFAEMELDDDLAQVLDPLIETLASLTEKIDELTRALAAESRSDELMIRLQEVPGVGPLVSLAYVAWMDRPERFAKSRDVGACLGLRPTLRSSGGQERRGRITREGDAEMRRLLVQAAHAAFLCRKETKLKQWAQALAKRIGKAKAVVALARKIAVLLHRLWVTDQSYVAFPATA